MPIIPARTGLKSIRLLLRKTCQLIAKFRDKWNVFMTPTQIAVFDELVTNCNAAVDIIDGLFGEL